MANKPSGKPGAARTRAPRADARAKITEDMAQDFDIAVLRAEMARLSDTVMQLAGLGAIDAVIINGFDKLGNGVDKLGAYLQPLRDLAPQHEPMEESALARLQYLRNSLAVPNWSSAGSLSVKEDHVLFIGEGAPPEAPEPPPPYNQAFAG